MMTMLSEFISNVCLGTLTVQHAFDNALTAVVTEFPEENQICCCDHDHHPDCIWWRYKQQCEREGKEAKACALHKPLEICECRREGIGTEHIEHKWNCPHVMRFYKTLENIRAKDGAQAQESYLVNGYQDPYTFQYSRKLYKLCCCRWDLCHTETQKFIYLAENGDRDKILPLDRNIEHRRKKQFTEPIEQDPTPSVRNNEFSGADQYRQLFIDRNREIHEMVKFLFDTQLRVLHIDGQSGLGKTQLARIALNLATERDPEQLFKDGVFLIDMEHINSIAQLENKLSQKIVQSQANMQCNMEDIATVLRQKNMCLVFDSCDSLLTQETEEALIGLKQLNTKIQSVKSIFITQQCEGKLSRLFSYKTCQQLKIAPLSAESFVKLFRRLLRAQKKETLLNRSDKQLIAHRIFKLFSEDFLALPYIVGKLNKNRDLDQIAADIDGHQGQASSQQDSKDQATEEQTVDQRQLLYISDCWNSLSKDYSQAKQIVDLLCETPGGLLLSQLQYLCRKAPEYFGQAEIVMAFLANFSCAESHQGTQGSSGSGNYTFFFHFKKTENFGQDQCQSDQASVSSGLKHHKSDEGQEIVYFIPTRRRHTLKVILDQKRFMLRSDFTDMILELNSKEIQRLNLSIQGMQSQNPLKRRTAHLPLALVSHLDLLFWQEQFCEKNEHGEFQVIKSQREALERFELQYQNFLAILDPSVVNRLFKKSTAYETEGQFKAKYSKQRRCLLKIITMLPAILVKTNRQKEAKIFMNQCSEVFPKEWNEMTFSNELAQICLAISVGELSYLDLRLRMDEVRTQRLDEEKEKALYGETFFLQGLELLIRARPQSNTESTSGPTEIQLAYQHFADACRHYEEIYMLRGMNQSVGQYANLGWDAKQDHAAIAASKTKLVRVEFILSKLSEFKTGPSKECTCTTAIDYRTCRDILHCADVYVHCTDMLTECLREYQRLKMDRHQVICMALQAKTYLRRGSGFIGAAKDLIEQVRIKNDTLDDNDGEMTSEIIRIQNQILHFLRNDSRNLLVFAKAFPLVEEKFPGGPVQAVGSFTSNIYDLRQKVKRNVEDLGISINMKFDVLNRSLLEYIGEFGCRLLHLSSDIFEPDKICIEGDFGICESLNEADFRQLFAESNKNSRFGSPFETQKTKKLDIDLVCLAIPQSKKIAEFFLKRGVKHVIAFDLPDNYLDELQINEQLDRAQLMPLRYNYMYIFCEDFYTQLVNQRTVEQAFESVKRSIEENKHQDDRFLDEWDLDQDLNIMPVLLPENGAHSVKVFDDNDQNIEKRLKLGKLVDTSKCRGKINDDTKNRSHWDIKQYTIGYTGNKKQIYKTQKALGDSASKCQLVQVNGPSGIGKTRFSHQVAYFFCARYYFQYGITYIDFSDSVYNFKEKQGTQFDLIKKSQTDKQTKDQERQFQKLLSDMNKKTKDVLFVFDNVDHLTNQRQFDRFGMTLRKMLQKDPTIKVIVTSLKPVNFVNIDNKTQFIMELKPLDPIRSADLLLAACTRRITAQEFFPDMNYLDASLLHQKEINQMLWDDQNLLRCKGIPEYIVEFAKHLSSGGHKNQPLMYNEVEVIEHPKEVDKLKGRRGHHLAKKMAPRKLVSFKRMDPDKIHNRTVEILGHDKEFKRQSSEPIKHPLLARQRSTNEWSRAEQVGSENEEMKFCPAEDMNADYEETIPPDLRRELTSITAITNEMVKDWGQNETFDPFGYGSTPENRSRKYTEEEIELNQQMQKQLTKEANARMLHPSESKEPKSLFLAKGSFLNQLKRSYSSYGERIKEIQPQKSKKKERVNRRELESEIDPLIDYGPEAQEIIGEDGDDSNDSNEDEFVQELPKLEYKDRPQRNSKEKNSTLTTSSPSTTTLQSQSSLKGVKKQSAGKTEKKVKAVEKFARKTKQKHVHSQNKSGKLDDNCTVAIKFKEKLHKSEAQRLKTEEEYIRNKAKQEQAKARASNRKLKQNNEKQQQQQH